MIDQETGNEINKYNAFISYRHSEVDMFVAKSIHKGLETYKVPGTVQKSTGRKKIWRVFRDQEELPIGSDLNDTILNALKQSEFLIVICTPRAVESEWVMREIDTFISLHGRENILAVLTEGEPDEAFPKQLLTDENGNPVEPLAADVRGKSEAEIKKKLKTEIVRLAAPLLHCSYDDLKQRHRERRMRRILFTSLGVAAFLTALGITFGIYSSYNAQLLAESYAIAQDNLRTAQINQSKFLADLSQSLLAEGDRRAAALVAREILPHDGDDRPFVPEAQYALSKALYAYDVGKIEDVEMAFVADLQITDVSIDNLGRYVSAVDMNRSFYVWDLADGRLLIKKTIDDVNEGNLFYVRDLCVCDNKLYLVSIGGIYVYDLSGNQINHVIFPMDVYGAIISSSAERIAVVGNERAAVYDMANLEAIYEVNVDSEVEDNTFAPVLALDAKGNRLALTYNKTLTEENIVDVWNLSDNSKEVITTQYSIVQNMNFVGSELVVKSCSLEDMIFNDDSLDEENSEEEGEEIELVGEKARAFFKKGSDRIIVYKEHSGPGMKEIAHFEEEIFSTGLSPNEKYYSINLYSSQPAKTYFFDAKTNEFVSALTYDDNDWVEFEGYAGDDYYYYISGRGDLLFYNIQTQEIQKSADFGAGYSFSKMSTDKKNNAVAFCDGYDIAIMDMNERKVTHFLEMSDYCDQILLKMDLGYIYGIDTYGSVFCVDYKTNQIRYLPEEIQISANNSQGMIAVNDDGSLGAFFCEDNVVRIWDMHKNEEYASITVDSHNYFDMLFSADGKRLYMQGSDDILRTYDLEKKKIIFIATKARPLIADMYEDTRNGYLIIPAYDALLFYKYDTMGLAVEAKDAKRYLSETDTILTTYEGDVYTFPFMHLDDLLEEIPKQFVDTTLSENERHMYYLDN